MGFFGAWMLPVVSALMWLGMLLGMFCYWIVDQEIYPSMQDGQTIAFISDVGAFELKPLFITGSVITTVTLDLGLIFERWYRHTGRLARNTSRAQKVLSSFAIVFAIFGAAGLILLSIFDTNSYPSVHNGCLLIFLGGYIISAILLCAEYQRLGVHYRNHRVLAISFWVKLVFIVVEVTLAAVFVGTLFTDNNNVAAVFEWVIALIFTGYALSFLLDLLPSITSRRHTPQGWREGEKGVDSAAAESA